MTAASDMAKMPLARSKSKMIRISKTGLFKSGYSTGRNIAHSLATKEMTKKTATSHSQIRRRVSRRRPSSLLVLFRCVAGGFVALRLGFTLSPYSDAGATPLPASPT